MPLVGLDRTGHRYEHPDRTGPDTQICRTGPAGLTFLNIIQEKIMKKKIENFEKKFWIYFYIKGSGVREGKKNGSPESGHFEICRTSGPDVMSG